MPFRYRLQKILDFRIRKKEEQLIIVQKAQDEVNAVDRQIQMNNSEIKQNMEGKRHAHPQMMDAYDKYLAHLWEKGEKLQELREEKNRILQEELHTLVIREQEVKVLEKHKDKEKEIYKEEEKQAELKQLSEIGVQKFFQRSRDTKAEQEYEEQQNAKYNK